MVFEKDGKIVVFYNDGIPPTDVPPSLWMRISEDGGKTWTAPIRPFSVHIGRSGEHALAVDSRGNAHAVFVQRIRYQIKGEERPLSGMWHSEFNGDAWSLPEGISIRYSGTPKIKGLKVMYAWHDVKAVISQGNVLLAVWRVDPGYPLQGVWYSYTILSAPALPKVDYAVITDEGDNPTPTPPPVTIQPTAIPPEINFQQGTRTGSNDYLVPTVIIGLLPVIALWGGYFWLKRNKFFARGN
jgi:hypothetical protein